MAENPLHTNFSEAFHTGARFQLPTGRADMRVHVAGELVVVAGKIVACDPTNTAELHPFTQPVPNGTYRVQLAIAKMENGDQRVAAARVVFGVGTVATWKVATIAGEDPDNLDGGLPGYGVDAGTGCFADADGAQELKEPEVQESIAEALQETYVHTWSWAEQELDHGSVVAFSSGYGDGSYASFWGFGADGKLLCLATDFGVLVEPVTDDVFFEKAGALGIGAIASPELDAHGIQLGRIAPLPEMEAPEGPPGGPTFEVHSTLPVDIELVDPKGERVPIAMNVASDGERWIFAFPGGLPADARLKVSVGLGVKPLDPVK